MGSQSRVYLAPVKTCSNFYGLLVSGKLDLTELGHGDLKARGRAHIVDVTVPFPLDL
jgi:hypothetical protein